jgi:acetyl-CoA carboxylase biotin carboxylase subunit
VKLQIRIAAGEPLPFAQEDVTMRGHAIECRIYAEDPDNNFFPSPGKILERRTPTGPGIRLDDGVYGGWTVPNEYDPMLGKLIAWGGDRAEAIARLRRALDEYYASGIKTNVSLFRRILVTKEFQNGEIYTRWLDDFLVREQKNTGAARSSAEDDASGIGTVEKVAILAAALWHMSHGEAHGNHAGDGALAQESGWKLDGRREQLNREPPQ